MKTNYKKFLIILTFLLTQTFYSQKILSLDECVDTAIKNSKQLKISENEVLKSEFKRKEIISNFWPKVNGAFDYKYYFDLPTQLMPVSMFNPQLPSWEYKAVQFGVPHNINTNIQVGVPLYNSSLFNGLKISNLAYEMQKLNYKKTKEDTYVLISNLYYNAQIIKNQIGFTKKNITNMKKVLKDLQLFYEQKLVTKNDVDKVSLQVQKLEANLKLLYNKYHELINALKLNMGTNEDFEVESNIIKPQLKQYNLLSSTEELMLEKKHEIAKTELKGIKKERLPQISAYGSYGAIGYGYDEKPHDFLDFYTLSFVGLKLNVPLIDLSRKKKIKQKKLDEENAKLQLELLKDKNSTDIKNATEKLNVQLELIENQKGQLQLAQSIYDKTVLQHKQDVASLNDVITAENEVIKAQQEYLTSIIEYLKTDLELKKLTGNLIPNN